MGGQPSSERCAIPTILRDARVRTLLLTRPLDAEAITNGCVRVSIASGTSESDERALQKFQLSIRTANDIEIVAPTPAGVRHGLTELLVLARHSHLQYVTIRSEPAFAVRGVLLDVSRNRVPTMRHMVEILDELALMRCNHMQLYFEHTFAYKGHEDAWQGCGAISPDELRRLDELAHERGIELVANQNCFGHLRHWLQLPRYRELAETHGEWMFDIWPRNGPFSLCPTDPRSLALVADWIAQQGACVQSKLFNINCDEVYDIAFGRSQDEVARRGRVAVFCEFVSKVAAITRSHGKRPMFWGDVVLSQESAPEHLGQLAMLREHDPIALVWGYEPDTPFDAWVQRVHSAGLEAWVCPGTSCWRSITGRATERRENIANAVRAGIANNVRGMLLCEWGDSGHWQPWPVTRHALREGLDAAWQGNGRTLRQGCAVDQFSDSIGEWLDRLADADIELRSVAGLLSKPGLTRLRNQTALFASLSHDRSTIRSVGHSDLWLLARDRIAALAASMPHDGSLDSLDSQCALERDELALTASMLVFASERAASMFEDASDSRVGVIERLNVLEREHRRLWLARSRTGGLEQSCSHFATIAVKTLAS
mgnify:CR=1 FL=1